MPTLSLAMIVKNEEKNLGHCLASVKDLVDEIVVVDTGSTDGTVALAQAFGARIGHFPWTGDFAAARNESLRLCTGDWVLVLDADEAVDALDHGRIREAIAQENPTAYNLSSRNYAETPDLVLLDQLVVSNISDYAEGASFPYYADVPILRLFRRFLDLRYEGRIHELVVPYFLHRNLSIGILDAVIHHYGKVDYEREHQKLLTYLNLAEKDAAAHPLKEQCQFNLMIQAFAANRYENAIRAGVAYTRLCPRAPIMVFAILGMAFQRQNRHKDAIACFETVLGTKPDHALALNNLITSLQALGRTEEARRHLLGLLAAGTPFGPPYFSLAELEEKEGRIGEARNALLNGLKALPDHERMHMALIQLDLRHQMEAQAASDAWAALAVLPKGGGGHWQALVAGFLLKSGNSQEGRAIVEAGLARFPEHSGLQRLKALADQA